MFELTNISKSFKDGEKNKVIFKNSKSIKALPFIFTYVFLSYKNFVQILFKDFNTNRMNIINFNSKLLM